MLMALGGTMWSESVAINRISLFGVPWVMLVLVFLMRWIYAPRQLRYLFFAMFVFGICGTIHQTLLCAGGGHRGRHRVTRPRLDACFFWGTASCFSAASSPSRQGHDRDMDVAGAGGHLRRWALLSIRLISGSRSSRRMIFYDFAGTPVWRPPLCCWSVAALAQGRADPAGGAGPRRLRVIFAVVTRKLGLNGCLVVELCVLLVSSEFCSTFRNPWRA